MITLSEGVRRKESKVAQNIIDEILNAVIDTFRFRITQMESWKNDTSVSLGGTLISSWHPEEESGKSPGEMFSEVLPSNVVVIKGTIEIPRKCDVKIDVNMWSPIRKIYSDVLIDTAVNERESIIDLLWTEKGKNLTIDLVKALARIRTEIDGRQRKTVSEVVMSPGVEDSDQFYASDYIGFYSAKAKPYYLLKKMISGALRYEEADTKLKSKLELFNLDKFAKRVYDISVVKRKFEVVDKRVAQLPIGSILFLARDKESFSTFAQDVREHIVKPSLEPLDYEENIIRKIEKSIESQDIKPLN